MTSRSDMTPKLGHVDVWEMWISSHERYATECNEILKGVEIDPTPPNTSPPPLPVPDHLLNRLVAVSAYLDQLQEETKLQLERLDTSKRETLRWNQAEDSTTTTLL